MLPYVKNMLRTWLKNFTNFWLFTQKKKIKNTFERFETQTKKIQEHWKAYLDFNAVIKKTFLMNRCTLFSTLRRRYLNGQLITFILYTLLRFILKNYLLFNVLFCFCQMYVLMLLQCLSQYLCVNLSFFCKQ